MGCGPEASLFLVPTVWCFGLVLWEPCLPPQSRPPANCPAAGSTETRAEALAGHTGAPSLHTLRFQAQLEQHSPIPSAPPLPAQSEELGCTGVWTRAHALWEDAARPPGRRVMLPRGCSRCHS